MRMIDADAMKADLLTVDPQYETTIAWCITVLDAQPTIEPERKTGEWHKSEAYPHHLYCSACYRTALPNYEYMERWGLSMNYCPNCGAYMGGGQDDSV